MQTIQEQAKRVYEQYELRPEGMQKRKFLMEIFLVSLRSIKPKKIYSQTKQHTKVLFI